MYIVVTFSQNQNYFLCNTGFLFHLRLIKAYPMHIQTSRQLDCTSNAVAGFVFPRNFNAENVRVCKDTGLEAFCQR